MLYQHSFKQIQKSKTNTEPRPKKLETCICMSCLEHIRNPSLFVICWSNTKGYLHSLSNQSRLQNEALACILEKKTGPLERVQITIPVGNDNRHKVPLRQLPRNREQMADFVINFVHEMNKKMNRWYNDNINTQDIHLEICIYITI